MAYVHLPWINSTGGPSVILQAAQADSWGGADDIPDVEDELESWGDYGTACRVEGWLGLVGYGEPGDGPPSRYPAEFGPQGAPLRALVLSGEPLMSTFLPQWRTVLRWHWANSYEHMSSMVDDRLPEADWKPFLDWEVGPGGLVLIDASCAMSDYGPEGWNEERPVAIDLEPGRYRLETAEIANTERTAAAIVHRFVPSP